MLKFNFRYAPWKDVLEWFAEQADLSLDPIDTPPGTWNYTDRRSYTPDEALASFNHGPGGPRYQLAAEGANADRPSIRKNEIPDAYVDHVDEKDLDEKGSMSWRLRFFSSPGSSRRAKSN